MPVNCYRIWLSVAQLLPPLPSPPAKGWVRSLMPVDLLPSWKGSMLQSIGPPPLLSPTDPQAVAHLSVRRKPLLLHHRSRTFWRGAQCFSSFLEQAQLLLQSTAKIDRVAVEGGVWRWQRGAMRRALVLLSFVTVPMGPLWTLRSKRRLQRRWGCPQPCLRTPVAERDLVAMRSLVLSLINRTLKQNHGLQRS